MSDNPNAQLPYDDIHHYFLYDPNWGACIFFMAFFAVLAVAVLYQAQRGRQYWLHALTLMAAMESGGYIARLYLYASPNDNAFKAELVILILAPNLLALTCYVVLGKLITFIFHTRAEGKADNWLTRHPHWIPYFYVTSDVLCISIQGAGGGILAGATTDSQLNRGKAVEVAGLALQIFFVGTFLIICIYVWVKMRQQPSQQLVKELTPAYLTLGALVALLVLRNVYRTIEFSTGGFTTGYFQENEAWYLVFDPTLMSLALMIALAFDFTKRLPHDCLNPPTKTTKTVQQDVEMGTSGEKKISTVFTPMAPSVSDLPEDQMVAAGAKEAV